MAKKTTSKKNVKSNKPRKKKVKEQPINNHKKTIILIVLFIIGILLIFSTYAWFSANLNVKVKEFNMVVSKNGGLTISFDGLNFEESIELNRDIIINNLKATYPSHVNQWATNGLTPVSTIGVPNSNTYFFDIYETNGIRYPNRRRENGYFTATKVVDTQARSYNNYIAFDLFFKNVTGSPVEDNLYFNDDTQVYMTSDYDEEMQGLVNSIRVGIVKVGSVPLDADLQTIQNIRCNNNCESIIFEPYSTSHTMLSRERAAKYDLDLRDNERFPTYAMVREGGPILVANNISGSPNLDLNYFRLQETIHEEDFDRPLFTIPDGITKARVYVWIEGQDIDSLETNSTGAELFIDLNFIKDTYGYESFN